MAKLDTWNALKLPTKRDCSNCKWYPDFNDPGVFWGNSSCNNPDVRFPEHCIGYKEIFGSKRKSIRVFGWDWNGKN